MSNHKFQTEVNQLLHLIIHSLYSNKEIFLRELISNASDALDKIRFQKLTNDKIKSIKSEDRIDISFNEDEKTITITDTGIGMNKKDLSNNLGTIARSGTKNFVKKLSGDAKKDSNLIGQFGVGFYSSFMVADKVEVHTKKAGEKKASSWSSDGKSGYTIGDSDKAEHGTEIKLFLNEEGHEFCSKWSLDSLIKKYSNHIAFPIYLHFEETKTEGEGDDKVETKEQKVEQMNSASAFWKQQKSSL